MSLTPQHIIERIDRPPAELIARIAKLHVGVTGFEVGPRQTMHPAIKPLDPAWRVCGPAVTVRPEQWYDRMVGELAPKFVQPGDVIVVDAGGHDEIAVWGMSMSVSAKSVGASGVVIDGATMNSALLVRERPQLPIFARAVSAVATTSEGRGSINVPVVCGGVIVHPGDIVLGDSDGVVVLTRDIAEAVIGNVKAHDAGERDPDLRKRPYWERRKVEEKLGALPGIHRRP
jgi:4-hydroxy-4-methyl-2-oxoglutarate aldolase